MKWHQEYQEYSKALRKFIEYKKGIDNKIAAFEKDIQEKESKVKQLMDKYTKDFMEGNKPDDKQIKELKFEIEYLKEQLRMIEAAAKEDNTLYSLANEVFKEYKELMNKSKEHYQRETEALEKLEEEYQAKREKLIEERRERMEVLAIKYVYPRLEAIPYMDIKKADRVIMENIAKGDYR